MPIHRYIHIGGRIATIIAAFIVPLLAVAQQSPGGGTPQTQVVLLGTGNPNADPDRSGLATAIVVNGTPYLVDFGPGVVRRAAAAVRDRGIVALNPSAFRVVFATHLHSDHTVGFPDLILSGWVAGRREPLEVYGPKGIKSMADHLLEAYSVDIQSRVSAGRVRPEVHAHEINAGVVYQDRNVIVTAFATKHAVESYGYRFQTPDRTIVVSGDTTPMQATIDACHGCDILIHQVIEQAAMDKPGTNLKAIAQYQTTSIQLAALATEAKPRLLVLYHAVFTSPEKLLEEMNDHYSGHVVVGRDLDIY